MRLHEQHGRHVDIVVSRLRSAKSLDEVKDVAFQLDMENLIERLKLGGDRIVYEIVGDDEFVLKVERASDEEDAYRQTTTEIDPAVRKVMREYAPRVYQSHPGGWWAVVERVQPIKPIQYSDWLSAAGISNPRLHTWHLQKLVDLANGEEDAIKWFEAMWRPEIVEELIQGIRGNELLGRLAEIESTLGIGLWDLESKNLGFGSDGRPVVLDLGVRSPKKAAESIARDAVQDRIAEIIRAIVRDTIADEVL